MRSDRAPGKLRSVGARALGVGTAAAMVMALSIPAANAAEDDDSEARAQLIDLDLNALGLDLDVLDAVTTESGNPSDRGVNTANIDVGVLNALGITLPGINLPLIGDGANGGLLDLGDAAAAGLLNGYAASPESTESTAASGAVGADGAIDADAGSSTDLARVDLTGPLGQLGVDGLTDQIIDELSLELGALASRAEASEGVIDREYLLAGAELNLSSPAVATLSDSVQAGVEDISDGVNALLGSEGAIQGVLDTLSIDPVVIEDPILGIELLGVDLGSPELNVNVDLSQITEGLLDEPLVSDNGLVTIDLDSGIVNVDLAMLHQGNLNGLMPNTELISSQHVTQIVQTVNELLYEVLDLVTEAVTETLETTELTLTLDPELNALGGGISGDLDVTLTGTLAQFTGQDPEQPEVDVSGSLIGISLDVVGDAIVGPIVQELVPGIGSALSPLLDDASGVVADAIEPLIDALADTLEPIFTEVLNEIASITVNQQIDGDDVTDWHSVSALNLVVLPLLNDAVELDLAHSAVRALDEDVVEEASIDVTPDEVEIGDDVTVEGSGFTPNSTVDVTFTDSEGNDVGTQEVDTDENGDFSTDFTIPEGTEFGDLEVTADDGDNQATGTTAVIESDDGTDEDGTDEDGTDEDGTDEDGTDEDGTDEDGTDEDGTDEDGTDEDGTDEDGTDEDGTDEDGTDEDGTDEDGTDEDGTDEDGTDEDGTDEDGQVSVTPDQVEIGDTIDVDGDGFEPNSTVTVTYTDADGNVVGTGDVDTDDDGSFQTDFVVPEGTAIGTLEVHATDGDTEATAETEVVEDDGTDEDGTDEDGTDQDGTDEDGTDEDGTDEDGTDEDGTDEDGTDQDGTDEDGTDQDGTDQDGTDQDGAAEDGGDEDGSDEDGAVDPTIVVDPDEAGVGDEITVDGDGFDPNTPVVVTYTDSNGNEVGTQEVTTDDDGAFTTSFEIPEGTALGDLEVHASDGENEATETIAIVDAAKTPPKTTSNDRATTTAGSGYLPRTGVEVMTLMMIALLAVVGGAGLVSVRNMKRNRR